MMKRLLTICTLSLLFSFRGCIEDEIIPSILVAPCNSPSKNIITETSLEGEIDRIAGIWIINLQNNDKKVRCVPCNLPENYKEQDRIIKFDASFLEIPPNVRLVGQPIEIKRVY